MNEMRTTNRLLLALLGLSLLQTYLAIERSVWADTLRLDFCITEKLDETPQQYLHVITHSPQPKKD